MSEAAPHILAALGEEVADDSDLTTAEHIDRIIRLADYYPKEATLILTTETIISHGRGRCTTQST